MVINVARFFLGFVGIAYIVLGVWCAVSPRNTSKAVGFVLQPGQGQSEFLTVYGGLEVGLGLVFLWPLYRSDEAAFPLLVCLVVHACLVLFRSLGFFVYTGFESMTYFLAAVEWAVFLGAAALFLTKQ